VTSSEVTFEILEPELEEEEENTGIDFNFSLDIFEVFTPDPFEFEQTWETSEDEVEDEEQEKVIE
jgi:hypothetical protein